MCLGVILDCLPARIPAESRSSYVRYCKTPARYTGASFFTLLAEVIASFRYLNKCTFAILSKSNTSQIQKYL